MGSKNSSTRNTATQHDVTPYTVAQRFFSNMPQGTTDVCICVGIYKDGRMRQGLTAWWTIEGCKTARQSQELLPLGIDSSEWALDVHAQLLQLMEKKYATP